MQNRIAQQVHWVLLLSATDIYGAIFHFCIRHVHRCSYIGANWGHGPASDFPNC